MSVPNVFCKTCCITPEITATLFSYGLWEISRRPQQQKPDYHIMFSYRVLQVCFLKWFIKERKVLVVTTQVSTEWL